MSILERLKALLSKNYNIDVGPIKPEAPIQSIGLDSLDMVDFFYAIEKEFKVKLSTQNLDLKSVQDLLDLVERAVKEQTPGEQPNRTAE